MYSNVNYKVKFVPGQRHKREVIGREELNQINEYHYDKKLNVQPLVNFLKSNPVYNCFISAFRLEYDILSPKEFAYAFNRFTTDMEELQILVNAINKYEENKYTLYDCFTVFFTDPYYMERLSLTLLNKHDKEAIYNSVMCLCDLMAKSPQVLLEWDEMLNNIFGTPY